MRRREIALGLWLAAGVAAAGTAQLPPGAIVVDAASTKSGAARLAVDSGAIEAAVAAGDAEGAFAALQAIDDPLRFELTAARVIDALQASPRGATEAFLARLESVPVRVFRRHDESLGDFYLPVVDVATRASSARRLIERAGATREWLAALERDPRAALETYRAERDAAAVTAAIGLASPALIARIESQAIPEPRPDGPWIAALAARSDKLATWLHAFAHGTPADVLPLIEIADRNLGDAAVHWLGQLASLETYRSAAVMKLGRMALDSPIARGRLAAALAHPEESASAAAALAQWPAPKRYAFLDAALAHADAGAVQGIALALRLDGAPEAERRLRKLLDDPRLPAAAKTELQR